MFLSRMLENKFYTLWRVDNELPKTEIGFHTKSTFLLREIKIIRLENLKVFSINQSITCLSA